ncbi:MAG: hypothetical protein NTZ69_16660 [Bacteroidia bacterium]|nr:hypothetical protein [Bacteroidia bacterium]
MFRQRIQRTSGCAETAQPDGAFGADFPAASVVIRCRTYGT